DGTVFVAEVVVHEFSRQQPGRRMDLTPRPSVEGEIGQVDELGECERGEGREATLELPHGPIVAQELAPLPQAELVRSDEQAVRVAIVGNDHIAAQLCWDLVAAPMLVVVENEAAILSPEDEIGDDAAYPVDQRIPGDSVHTEQDLRDEGPPVFGWCKQTN